jgi:hypothetical protein
MRPIVPALLVALCGAATASAQAKPTSAELAKLLADTDRIAATVSAIRGLPVKKPIARGVMGKPEIEKRLKEKLDEDFLPGELAGEEVALKRLGLIPVDMSYRQEIVDLLTEQIAGFYDPAVHELYIADWMEADLQRMVMAHEIDHALQDQRYDLERFMKGEHDNTDAQLARQAVAEGDGIAVMMEFKLREMGMQVDPWADDSVVNLMSSITGLTGAPQFDKAPLYLRETVLFPYREGLRLIASSRRTHPWSDVDGMYARPPSSSEQVIHPEKYRANERPIGVKAAPLAALKEWKAPYLNVLGELALRVLFEQHGLVKERAERAAAGWGGDRLAVYQSGQSAGASLAIDLSVWDAEADALEAFEALADILPALAVGAPGQYTERGPLFVAAAGNDGTVSQVERKGSRVLLVVGAPAALAPRVRAEAWAKWKVLK